MRHPRGPLVAAIEKLPGKREPDRRPFFFARYDNARDPWDAAAKRAGIRPLTPHCCRHGLATGRLHQGVDPITVARRDGRKSPAQLFKTYGQASDGLRLSDLLMGTPQANDVLEMMEVLETKSKIA